MSKLTKLVALLAMAAVPATGYANEFKFNPSQTIKLLDVVDGRMAVYAMSEFDAKSKDGAPIHVLINSPGGSIFAGNLIINGMRMARARGSEIHCVSTVYAASMAFQFLMECTHRYALQYTELLFHPPRVSGGGALVESDLRQLAEELAAIERKMVPKILEVLRGIEDTEFWHHYHKETWWDADDLIEATNSGWLHLVTNVTGIQNVFQLWPDRSMFINEAEQDAANRIDTTDEALIWINHRAGSNG